MERFTTLEAVACPLALENVDTDQLIPARFMSCPRSAGYGDFLLHDRRFGKDGASKDFILDHPARAGAKILVARRNFGTGSSREAAVYALWDFGIRCVIAPSFGDIFASNAVKNGLLPAQVSDRDAHLLLDALASAGCPLVAVNLETQTLGCGAMILPFVIEPMRRLQLLNGWDDLDLTALYEKDISAFRKTLAAHRPWAFVGKPVSALSS